MPFLGQGSIQTLPFQIQANISQFKANFFKPSQAKKF